MEFSRNIKCSNCGYETDVRVVSGLELSQLLIAGKCPECGNSLQLSYDIVRDQPEKKEQEPPQPVAPPTETGPSVSLDNSIFNPELPSDTIKDIMDD
jgi:hypothetical protein